MHPDVATIIDNLDELYLRRQMVRAYSPEWHYEMGKVGYQCAYCRRLLKSNADAYDPYQHKGTCAWALSKLFLQRKDASGQEVIAIRAAKAALEQPPPQGKCMCRCDACKYCEQLVEPEDKL